MHPRTRQFFEVIDTLTGEIERRFVSESNVLYTTIEKLLLSAAKGELTSSEDLHKIVFHFHDNLDETDLSKILGLLKNVITDWVYLWYSKEQDFRVSICFFTSPVLLSSKGSFLLDEVMKMISCSLLE